MEAKRNLTALLLLSLGACTFDEGLNIENINGTVVIPAELVDRTYIIDGQTEVVNDVRNIGPVFLGVYPDVLEPNRIGPYSHPDVGPAFDVNRQGDAYPYGGTSIGSYRPLCFEALQCRVVSGRFVDWDALAYWFSDVLQEPVVDYFGNETDSGEFIRQTCLEAFNHTTDIELGVTAYEDRNGDDEITEADLDFVRREDGNWEASFKLWQQEFFEDARVEDGQGMTLWGFMDAPAPGTGSFSTCVEGGAFTRTIDYNQNFRAGTGARNVLNRPGEYIQVGDIVTGEQEPGEYGHVFEDINDNPELWLNFEVQ